MKHFKLKVIGLLILILGCLVSLAQVIGQADFFFTQLVLLVFLGLLLWQLFRFINKSNEQLATFLMAIKYQDGHVHFPEKIDPAFNQLHHAFNQSIEQIRQLKVTCNQTDQWMKLVLERIPLGVLLCDEQGYVLYGNTAIQEILSCPLPKQLNKLNHSNQGLAERLNQLKSGQKQQIKLIGGSEILVQKTHYREADKKYVLYYLQAYDALKGEVELDAWMNLMKVLTHEIMNSITAISSLASSMQQSIEEQADAKDLSTIAERIEKRSKGLIEFTNSYREVSSVKAPNFAWFDLYDLVQEQINVLQESLEGIEINLEGDTSQNIYADRSQMAQIFINLFLNSKQALEGIEKKRINISFKQVKDQCLLEFTDNGKGISAEHQNKVFVPFYTTKPNGKGIGLSLCRQLMRNNEASISLAHSERGKTTWLLRWTMQEL